MKVLVVHERYRSTAPSGEGAVVAAECRLLQQAGIRVFRLCFANDRIGTPQGPSLLRTALSTPWSPAGRRMVRQAVVRHRPDVVHVHNTFPYLSQAVLWEARRLGAAVVQTLHNYRWVCANGLLMRHRNVCTHCLCRLPWPALIHRCYRRSALATAPVAAAIALFRLGNAARRAVDRFIVLTPFARRLFVQAGFPADRLVVRPNWVQEPRPPRTSGPQEPVVHPKKGYFLFVGRLSAEKGADLLPKIWQKMGPSAPALHIVGDGPLKRVLEMDIRKRKLAGNIKLTGQLGPHQVHRQMQQAAVLVMPSLCYEGFPMTVAEAYAAGLPVAASRIGSLQDLVAEGKTGALFSPGKPDDAAATLLHLAADPQRLARMGRLARQRYEQDFSARPALDSLMAIYRQAVSHRRSEAGPA